MQISIAELVLESNTVGFISRFTLSPIGEDGRNMNYGEASVSVLRVDNQRI